MRLAIEDKIRYGEKIVQIHDGVRQIYQLMFKELTGLSIGGIYLDKHLQKYSKRDFFARFGNAQIEDYFKTKNYKDYLHKINTHTFEEYF